MLWFEKRWLPQEDISKGFITEQKLNMVTYVSILAIFLFLYTSASTLGLPLQILLAVVLGRLLALDLTYLILPDVYTLPLIGLGLLLPPLFGLHSWIFGLIGAVIGFVFPLVFAVLVEKISKTNSGMGGGDIKLLAAMGAWLGPINLAFSLPIACFATLAFALRIPKNQDLPFGPGLIISFIIFLCFSEKILALLQG